MTEGKQYYTLLNEVLGRCQYESTISSIPGLNALTTGDGISCLEVNAQLIPLLASMGKQGEAQDLLEMSRSISKKSEELSDWLKLVEMNWFISAGKYQQAIELCDEICLSSCASQSVKFYASASALGAYRILVQYEKLIQTGTRLLEEENNPYWEMRILGALGVGLYEVQLFDSAETHLQEAFRIEKTLGENHWIAEALCNLGVFEAYKARSHESFIKCAAKAITILEQAKEFASKTSDHALMSFILDWLCTSHLYHGSPIDICRGFGEDALRYAISSGQGREIAIASVIVGDIFWRIGNYSEAGIHFERAVPLIDYPFHYSGLLVASMAAVSAVAGKPDEAIKYRQNLEESLYTWSKHRLDGVSAFQHTLEERELARQTEVASLRENFLERELSNTTLLLLAQTEFLSEFREGILVIVRKAPATEPIVKELREKLKELPCKSLDWDKFEVQFKLAHPEFLLSLTKNYPDLSKMETRICTLLRMNLKSPDISSLTCLSLRNIENHRYRIRKKMNLQHDDELSAQLFKI